MRYVELAGERASVIGLGTWQFGARSWGWDPDEGEQRASAIVARAIDLGINFFDTAEVYAGGESERLLGQALRGRDEHVIVASKVWPTHGLRSQVRSAAARSLNRLGLREIGLYQVHWPNPLIPTSQTMAGMRDLLETRTIRHAGVSNFNLRRWRRADAALGAPVAANQVSYHLLNRKAEDAVLPFAQANERVVIAYSPLAQGLLSGKYHVGNLPGDVRRAASLFTPSNVARAQDVLDALRDVAAAQGATRAQIALAWLVHQPHVIAIPGAKSVQQVEENAAAADIDLSRDELLRLNAASAVFSPARGVRSLGELARRLLSR